jgi:para-nitrobenzyl esterase
MPGGDVIVDVGAGQLEGERTGEVSVFRGVRYAEAPVGPLRFRPPEPVRPWAGIRQATSFAPICPQIPTGLEAMQGRMDLPMDEDCLALNIWTPGCDGAHRPVLVWIHGGAWLNGSGAADWFDGSSFARLHDIVVVTIGYRLNVFGFLHLGLLASGETESGHVGMLDQIAALEWVRDHIEAFGGDPGAVTIAGESAGAMSVGTLLAMPPAHGLFHRAIMQSGVGAVLTTPQRAHGMTEAILGKAGIPADDKGPAALRQLSHQELLDAYLGVLMDNPMEQAPEEMLPDFAPVVGLPSLPEPPFDAIASGVSGAVAVLLGTDEHEMEVMRWSLPAFYDFDDATVDERMHRLFGDQADTAQALYKNAAGDSGRNRWTSVDTDRLFRVPADRMATLRADGEAPTYLYLWRWPSTAMEGRLGAVHTVEIPFVFNTLTSQQAIDTVGALTPEAAALALRIHATIAAFVRTGDPNTTAGLGHWPAFNSARRPVMVIDANSGIQDDPYRDHRLLWERSGLLNYGSPAEANKIANGQDSP